MPLSFYYYFKRDERRHTNLRKLFAHNYHKRRSGLSLGDAAYASVAESATAHIDEACLQSCLVFVDGVLTPQLSRLAALPPGVSAGSLLSSGRSPCLLDVEPVVPDTQELPRDSFASDLLGALNLVR